MNTILVNYCFCLSYFYFMPIFLIHGLFSNFRSSLQRREIGMGGQGVAGAMLGGAWNTLGQVGHLFFCNYLIFCFQ